MSGFSVVSRIAERGQCLFIAEVGGRPITSERYAPGTGEKRKRIAEAWAHDERIGVDAGTIEGELEAAELAVLAKIDEMERQGADASEPMECASYIDDEVIAELAWNIDKAGPDFIVYDRATGIVSRADKVQTATGPICVPGICKGIVTPGSPISGLVYLPTEADAFGRDDFRIRADLERFISRYVELPGQSVYLAVEYVMLSWVFDAFDELPYIGFRTADCGRGKSRALETVGALCYRPLICGGGSSAAATLRMLDVFKGTLLADEFDAAHNTELGADLNRLLNQGFQRNRPLTKCDGENNAPRAFWCYGPKLFALRSKLGDDATESRTIFITMRERTRDDVPINLPRREFDEQSLSLRNRLLAWRFSHFGSIRIDPTLADPGLEDRQNQIGVPLLSVAREDTRELIVVALREQQSSISADRSISLAGEVFDAILSIAQPGEVVHPGEVSAVVNRQRAEQAGVEVGRLGRIAVTPHMIGKVMSKDLELPHDDTFRDKRGIRFRLARPRMESLARRYGGTLPASAQSTPSTQVHPDTRVFDVARAENVLDALGVLPRDGGVVVRENGATSRTGLMPDGWPTQSWIRELRRMADTCEGGNPEQAAEYRQQADAFESGLS